jgi:hypothetical protein
VKSPTAYTLIVAAVVMSLMTAYCARRSPIPPLAISTPIPSSVTPTVSTSATVQPRPMLSSPVPLSIPSPTDAPLPTPASAVPNSLSAQVWNRCQQIGNYRTVYTFETQHFYINLCRREHRLIYTAESKINPDEVVQLPAEASGDRGYQANHRNTSYRVISDEDGFIWLQVLFNGHLVREERSLYRVELPQSLPPHPVDPVVEWQACNQLGEDYREFYAFETANYYINLCQKAERFYYLGQPKASFSNWVELIAQPVRSGVFTARNGVVQYITFDYRTIYGAASEFELIIMRNGQTVVREASLPSDDRGSDWLSTTLSCDGDLETTNLSFSIEYSPENGFNHVELRQKISNRLVAEVRLSYQGQDRQGRDRFGGSVNNKGVTVLNLAPNYVEAGTQVSVSYDGQWGRGTCR